MERAKKTLCSKIACTWSGGCDAATCWPGGYGCKKPRIPRQNTTCSCEAGEEYEYGCKGFQYPTYNTCSTRLYYGTENCSSIDQGCKNPDTEGEFCFCDDGYMTMEDGSCAPKPADLDVAAYSACTSIENNEGAGQCNSAANCVNPTFELQKYCVY